MAVMTRSAKQPTNITLDAKLVRQARELTPNLSATVARLLEDYVAAEHAKRHDEDEVMGRLIAAMDEARSSAGLLSDEFNNL